MEIQIQQLLGVIISVSTVITIIATGVRWLVKHYFEEIKKELKPNGGSSLKDQVNRLEATVKEIKEENFRGEKLHEKLDSKIDNLTTMFIDFLSNQKN